MYKEFYGLTEEPFNITPDPKFLYFSKKHEEGLRNLLYVIERKKGLILLTGEVGTGKTTLLNGLIQRLNRKSHIAFLVDPQTSPSDMFKNIFHEFGLEINGKTKADILIELKNFLLEHADVNEDCILILDDSQDSSYEALEQLRLFLNFETHTEKLIQIILVGHPELRHKLNLLELAKLKQRIDVMYNLLPLNHDETAGYIGKRLATAGAVQPLFTTDAIEAVYRCSGGIPRVINIVCDLALLAGFGDKQREIGRSYISQAAEMAGLYEPEGYGDRNADTAHDGVTAHIIDNKQVEHESTQDSANLSALSELPRGTWKAEPLGKRAGQQGSRRLFYASVAAGVLFGLVLAWGLARRSESGTNVLTTLSQSIRRFFVAEQAPTRAAMLPSTDRERATQQPVHTPSTTTTVPPTQTVAPIPVPGDKMSEEPESNPHTFNQSGKAMAKEDSMPPDNVLQDITPPANQGGVSSEHTDAPTTQQHLQVRRVVIIRSGDTLGDIIQKEYGQYRIGILALVQKANPDITDPAVIHPNQRIILPVLPK